MARRKFLAWLTDVKTLVLSAGAILAMVAGAFTYLDQTYTRSEVFTAFAGGVSQQFQQVDRTLKQSQYHALRREEFEWLRELRQRPLSSPELRRLREIQDAIRKLEHELGLRTP